MLFCGPPDGVKIMPPADMTKEEFFPLELQARNKAIAESQDRFYARYDTIFPFQKILDFKLRERSWKEYLRPLNDCPIGD